MKIRSGQVWASNHSKNEFTLNVGANGLIHGKSKLGGIYNWDKSDFHRNFKFVPQNDLEWLAVNIEKFPTGIFNYLFWDAENLNHGIENTTYQQWQNMRYHLGLDKKPRYDLTKCEWVKQC